MSISTVEPQSAAQVLDREYLEIRAKILQLAASFDRLQRGSGSKTAEQDARYQLLRTALECLLSADEDRAEQIQLLFSREYDPKWRTTLGIDP